MLEERQALEPIFQATHTLIARNATHQCAKVDCKAGNPADLKTQKRRQANTTMR